VSEPNATPARSGMLRSMLVLVVVLAGLTAVPATSSVTLKTEQQEVRALAAEVAALDARIDKAIVRYAQAAEALEVVRASVVANREAVLDARREVGLAQALLADRARSLYKQSTPTPVDVLFGAGDFGDVVSQLGLLQRLGSTEADYVRAARRSERELRERSLALAADRETAERLVADCAADLAAVRAILDERRALLDGAEARVRELAAEAEARPAPSTAVPAVGDDDGRGDWWPAIARAAAANDVSAEGMYRLMLAESGGSATIVGPGGYYGLYQYSISTWRGSWNPYRSASVYDGEAQIKASALAVAKGYGPSFWPSTYDWAFRD
jgi:peptidoglycan hydrolase CwlO-like protein